MLNKLQTELKIAMKTGEKIKVNAYRNMISKLKIIQIDKGSDLEEVECLKALQNMAKQIQDSIIQFKKGGRKDLVISESQELEIIKLYLPKRLSEEEMRNIISAVIENIGANEPTDQGKVMPIVMENFAGRGDGKFANQLVKTLLAK